MGLGGIGFLSDKVSAASIPQIRKDRKVELAIATITMGGFEDNNFEKAFEILPQLPFKNVEINCWYSRTLTPKRLRNYQGVIDAGRLGAEAG